MRTWVRRYLERVNLLVQVLPLLDAEPRFALKGGTAINLFEHDMPPQSPRCGRIVHTASCRHRPWCSPPCSTHAWPGA